MSRYLMGRVPCGALLLAGSAAGGLATSAIQPPSSPEERAIAFLSTEVPRWAAENDCYSCHNNGDAARALYTARGMALAVKASALRDTTEWLRRPDAWDDNAQGQEFSDQTLARIQFAAALVSAIDAGVISDSRPLGVAAGLIAANQQDDGSWRLDVSASIGSPATHGTALATWAALRTLRRAEVEDLAGVVARGESWLRAVEVKAVLDAAAVVLALGLADDPKAVRQRQTCLDIIVRGQAPSGGWGAYLVTSTEPFDTAVVVLALVSLREAPGLAAPTVDERAGLERLIADGRSFLLAEQLDDGGWVETTRPPGQQSYAQHISTSGWATLALLATRDRW